MLLSAAGDAVPKPMCCSNLGFMSCSSKDRRWSRTGELRGEPSRSLLMADSADVGNVQLESPLQESLIPNCNDFSYKINPKK